MPDASLPPKAVDLQYGLKCSDRCWRVGADPALGGAELDEFSISVGATDYRWLDPEITERQIDLATTVRARVNISASCLEATFDSERQAPFPSWN